MASERRYRYTSWFYHAISKFRFFMIAYLGWKCSEHNLELFVFNNPFSKYFNFVKRMQMLQNFRFNCRAFFS